MGDLKGYWQGCYHLSVQCACGARWDNQGGQENLRDCIRELRQDGWKVIGSKSSARLSVRVARTEERVSDLRDRLLAEIDRRLAVHFYVCEKCGYVSDEKASHENRDGKTGCFYTAIDTHAKEHEPLRALRREVERHHVNPLAGKQKFCVCCEAQAGKSPEGWIIWQWPCPSILETAREMGVGDE